MAPTRIGSNIPESRPGPRTSRPSETADRHIRSIQKSAAITRYFLPQAISPFLVIDILNEECVHFVLVGTYAFGGWMRKPRAADDIDILTPFRHHKRAVNALITAIPSLQVSHGVNVTVLHHPEASSIKINLIKPKQTVFRVAAENTIGVHGNGFRFRVPTLEMAITMKWVRMRTGDEDYAERYLHAHDFLQMLTSNLDLDLATLAQLCESVCPGQGEADGW